MMYATKINCLEISDRIINSSNTSDDLLCLDHSQRLSSSYRWTVGDKNSSKQLQHDCANSHKRTARGSRNRKVTQVNTDCMLHRREGTSMCTDRQRAMPLITEDPALTWDAEWQTNIYTRCTVWVAAPRRRPCILPSRCTAAVQCACSRERDRRRQREQKR